MSCFLYLKVLVINDGNGIGLLPDTYNCWLRMRRGCRERFLRRQLKRKPLVSDPGMQHGTYVTHVPWFMSGSLTRGGGENDPGNPLPYDMDDIFQGIIGTKTLLESMMA